MSQNPQDAFEQDVLTSVETSESNRDSAPHAAAHSVDSEAPAGELGNVDNGSAEDGGATIGNAENVGEKGASADAAAADKRATGNDAGEKGGTDPAALEREGDLAADFLEKLLDIADVGGDIDLDVVGDRASVAIVAEDGEEDELKVLIGRNGEVLDALQELTRLAVQAKTGNRTRLMLDVSGYRETQKQKLITKAKEAVASARQDGAPVHLEAMNPFERKVIHDYVAEAGLTSGSEGVGPARHVVVSPSAN